ncbi:MAG: putative bifunctional diguanylate cyclase/phosphodiesterase [Chloroflexota bacterium]
MASTLGPRARGAYNTLRERITSGELRSGERLPNRLDLARELGVATMTLNQAIDLLDEDGLVSVQHGRGTFVLPSTSSPTDAGEALRVAALALQDREAALRLSEARFRAIFSHAPIGINVTDANGCYVQVNNTLCAMLGYTEAELLTRAFTEITHPDDAHIDWALFEDLRRGKLDQYQIDKRYVHKDGTPIWVRITTCFLSERVNGVLLNVGMVEDITERKHFEEQLEYQATHDALTDLPNRALLQDRLRELVSSAPRAVPGGLLLMDLDGFKMINDTFGHHNGDSLLQQVAMRLQGALRDSDTVSRLGGDEFAVLLPMTDEHGARRAVEKIEEALAGCYFIEGNRVEIRASIGIALYPHHGADGSVLLRRADAAMYEAKRNRLGSALYNPEWNQDASFHQALTADLRHAIERDQLVLCYQPKVRCDSGYVDGVEALVRWQHPEQGLIPPNRFIQLAEETGLIGPLTIWVLKHALRQCAVWRRQGLDIDLSVNLSARNLIERRLPEQIEGMIRSLNLAPSTLTVEITESTLMADLNAADAVLSRLHATGVRVAIDDFGAGYSSLSYLEHLPIDELKIDKTLVQSMTATGLVITKSIIDLGRRLGLEVVAEGMEDDLTLQTVAGMGCTAVQGNYVCQPLPASDVLPWIVAHQAAHLSRDDATWNCPPSASA